MAEAVFQGLTSQEAERRLAEYGANVLPQEPPPGVFAIVLRTLKEPMFFLLVGAATLYLVIGDLGEGLFMVAGAAASIALVVFQELRTEKALQALRDMAEPMAHVLRGGAQERIKARDLVPGDIILVGEGERLPADAVLRGGDALLVDESALTGESATVTKIVGAAEQGAAFPAPGGDATPYLYSGTMVTRGSGVAEAVRTGPATAIGAVGASLAAIETEPTPLQQTTGALVARLGALALAFCALVIVVYGLVHGDWIEGGFAGITLAIGLLPEEFPMVLAVFLALGAWRLARRNVLVRRSAATETLGSATILCVDKTGTLTQNRMTVVAVSVGQGIVEARAAREEFAPLLRAALRACAPNPIDPMDRAVHALAAARGVHSDGEPLESFAVRPERLAFIQRWRAGGGELFAAKGAPEAVLALVKSDAPARERYERIMRDLAERGYRVLAVAETAIEPDREPLDREPSGSHPASEPEGSRSENGQALPDVDSAQFTLLGLLAFEDPVREEVPEAVAAARRAGVEVAMITGDYAATALAIAKQAGIETKAGVLAGDAVSAMSEQELQETVAVTRVFSRVTPNAKLAIVEAFKAKGHIVAMTGDGVNDGPALAAAHIGIAMGKRGTDVARESAAIVLLDDSFASIISGIKLGRRIFGNLRRALTYIVAIHVPIAGLALLPILMGLPPLLLPAHVVLMELVIDPTCSLVFESEPGDADAMLKPPRRAGESLFGGRQMLLGVFQGLNILLAVMSVYVIEIGLGAEEHQARGVAFAALICGNLVLALSEALPKGASPISRETLPFWIIAAAAGSVIAASLYVPWMTALLRFEPPTSGELAFALALAIVAGGWYGVWRRLMGRDA